jgi:nitrogen fixation NifU-like protein
MFSETVMEHFRNPRNAGVLEPCSAVGTAGSPESGRFVQLFLSLRGERIETARFRTYGCVPVIAAASYLTEWVEGRTVEEAMRLTARELSERLGGLPPRRGFCAELAIEALRRALAGRST